VQEVVLIVPFDADYRWGPKPHVLPQNTARFEEVHFAAHANLNLTPRYEFTRLPHADHATVPMASQR
jgi:hypothetical protein